MQCPNCETENRDDAQFCDECGFPLSGSFASAVSSTGLVDATAFHAEDPEEESAEAEPTEDVPEEGADQDNLVRAETDEETAEAAISDSESGEDLPSTEDVGPENFGDAEGMQNIGEEDVDPALEGVDPALEDSAQTQDEAVANDGAEDDAKSADSASSPSDSWLSDRAFVPSDELDYYDDLHEEGNIFAGASDTPPRDLEDEWPRDITMKMPKIEGEESPKSRDFMSSSTKKKQRDWKRIGVIAGCVVAAIALVAIVAAFAGGLLGGKQIPNVVDMTEADATVTLESAGFTVRSLQVPSDETDGLVLIMDPVAGSRAEEGSEVVIQVATSRVVPDVVGKSYDEAMAAFEEAGYKNVRVEKKRTDDEENVVVSVEPEAGARVKSTAEVVLTITEGYYVPDISDMDLDTARAAIEEAGLTPEAIYVDTSDYIDGTLLGTTPEAGTKMSGGDVVVINIARARGAELLALTQGLLAPGGMITVGGYNYDIESLDAIEYLGNDTVAFTFSGRPKVMLFGETLYASTTQVVSGTVVWSETNEVISIG